MSDYSNREPTTGDIRDQQAQQIAKKEDFGFHYDQRSRLNRKVHFYDESRQQKYDKSRAMLLSSPLVDGVTNPVVNKFVDDVLLLNFDDPFDAFCELVAHFKGISKDLFIKMDTDERAKREKK